MTPAARLRQAAQLAPQVIQPHEVALAVAAWLEASARAYETLAADRTSITYLTPASVPTMTEALTAADALLSAAGSPDSWEWLGMER